MAAKKAKQKKRSGFVTFLTVFSVIIILGVVIYAASNLYVLKSAEPYIMASEDASPLDADCILVLGCKANGDEPSLMLRHRLETGIQLCISGASEKLLMSGDHGTDGYDEVYAMKKYALESGMNTDAVFCDHAGFSTYDSLYRAKEIFGCKKLIVVTQRFHLARAVYIGRRLGMEVYGVECDNGYVYGTAKTNALRESLARVKAVLDCELLKPQSKYLGEAIPISGKGSETDDKSFENKKDKT